MDWKAISAGVVATIVFWLVSQLVYVLAASAIGIASAHSEWVFFSDYKEQLWFVTAMMIYCLTMIVGGLITSFLCNDRFVLNASIAGGLTGCLIVATSFGLGQLTMMSVVLVILGFVFAALGGLTWVRFFKR